MNPQRATARPTVAGQRSMTNSPINTQRAPVIPASQPAVRVASPSPGTQTALPTAPAGTQPNGPSPNSGQSWLKWGMDTNVTINVCSLAVGILAIVVSVVFGTAAWIQSSDSHKSLLLAKWQSCATFPDNPQIEQSEWCKVHSSLDWDREFSKRGHSSLWKPELHILESLPPNIYVPPGMDPSSCHVVCTRSYKYRPSGSIWLADQYIRMTTCSDEPLGPPPRSFTEFLHRIIPIYSTFALDLATTWLLVFYWPKILSSKRLYRRILAMQEQYITVPPQEIYTMRVFVIVPSICLTIYIWLPGYVDPGRGWRQAFYTGVFVIFLPWVVPWTAGGNRRITLKSVLDVYRSWAVYHVAAQFWATLYLFRYLLWKYSNMSSCAYERLYMISDWRNMVWFWDLFNEWGKDQ